MEPGREVAQLGDSLTGLLDRGPAQLRCRLGVELGLALGQAEREDRAHELLLGAVVEVAGELGAGGVGGLDDAPARRAQLRLARLGDVALAREALGLELLFDVPSRRMNQSSSRCTASPVRIGSSTGQSAAGYGVPSGCW